MKKIILFFSLLGVLLVISGCDRMSEQKITVQKRMGEENFFEEFKEVTQNKQVEKAIDIVDRAKWGNEKIKMERYADYQFQFRAKNNNDSSEKIASYLLWISSNNENIEIVTDSEKYMKLSKQDSTDLYKILTGEALIK